MQPRIDQDGTVLTLSNSQEALRFHAIWLRDNAQDPETPRSGQWPAFDCAAGHPRRHPDQRGQKRRLTACP